jgi:hypothetical protein
MSFGFGFGLTHHVAKLGGGGPPVGGFLSLTSSGASNLKVLSIYVDASGNVIIFGDYAGIGALALKLDSTGALSLSDQLTPAQNARAIPDGSGNLYATLMNIQYFCCCGYSYAEVVKLSSSFSKLAGICNGYGNGAGGIGPPILDASGNLWVNQYDGSCGNALFKYDPTLTTITEYYFAYCGGFFSVNGFAVTSTNNLITSGGVVETCGYSYTPFIFSVPVATPTATQNWAITGTVYNNFTFLTAKVDSSNNVYVTGAYAAAPTQNWVGKISASGSLPLAWQYTFTGIFQITNFAIDSSANIYAVATNATNGFTIIKLNSSGAIQFSRKLTPSTGSISSFAGTPNITIDGSYIYIAATYVPPTGGSKVLAFKVPTDGTGTKTISVGGYNFTYAIGSVTASAATESFTTATAQNASVAVTAGAGVTSVSSLTASTAVTVL